MNGIDRLTERIDLDISLANHLTAAAGPRGSTLPPDYTARLLVGFTTSLGIRFEAGETCEVVGEFLRFHGGQVAVRTVTVDGVSVPALSIVEPYTPPAVEMIESPYTGALVPVNSGTGRRARAMLASCGKPAPERIARADVAAWEAAYQARRDKAWGRSK